MSKTVNPIGRSRFEGVLNIVRFNWHFYALALAALAVIAGLVSVSALPGIFNLALVFGAATAFFYLCGSLLVSHIIYDRSDLYRFAWLRKINLPEKGDFINIHSGFDETSLHLQRIFPHAGLQILDFYDPKIHTEISIARARKHRPPLPQTTGIQAGDWKLESESADAVFGLLAVHEIRSDEGKAAFFGEARRVLRPGGVFVLAEHLRDPANFMAYGPGFLHFFPESTWRKAFAKAGFQVADAFRITPFVRIFVLKK